MYCHVKIVALSSWPYHSFQACYFHAFLDCYSIGGISESIWIEGKAIRMSKYLSQHYHAWGM